jgi:hypothetical protein
MFALSMVASPGGGVSELARNGVRMALPLLALGSLGGAVAVFVAAPALRPASAQTQNTIKLWQGGPVRAVKEGSETACFEGDFDLYTPTPSQRLITNYTTQPNGYVSAETRAFDPGQELVFAIYPAGGICDVGPLLSTDTAHARVTVLPGVGWRIQWEDHLNDPQDPPSGDFNDLTVRVEALWPEQAAPPGSDSNAGVVAGLTRDPINTFTGSYLYRRVDIAIPGRGPSPAFARAFNTFDTRVGPLGVGWTHSYNIRLVNPGGGTSDVLLVGPDGRTDRYTYSGGTYTPPNNQAVLASLTRDGSNGTYKATHKDLTEWHFDTRGRLSKIRDRYGNESQMTYDTGTGLLTQVSDPAGRGNLTLRYATYGDGSSSYTISGGRTWATTAWPSAAAVAT